MIRALLLLLYPLVSSPTVHRDAVRRTLRVLLQEHGTSSLDLLPSCR